MRYNLRVSDSAKQKAFTKAIQLWFARHKRVLPWRDLTIKNDTERAYRILVSEVMLQQTQVPRVEILFKKFMQEFPSLEALSKASNKEILIAWRGLGYNSRAIRLRDAAKSIINDHDAKFPKQLDELLSIKGIGPYTASAIRNFAFNQSTVCIDTNIRRILHRVFYGPEKFDETKGTDVFVKSDRQLIDVAEKTLKIALDSKMKTGDWHAALMDFGSLVCTKRNPKCATCPEQKICSSAFKIGSGNKRTTNLINKEPGRMLGGRFIPNRIFRGRIVEALRDHHSGLSFERIGAEICVDWNMDDHKEWLKGLLAGLVRDSMIQKKRNIYLLAE